MRTRSRVSRSTYQICTCDRTSSVDPYLFFNRRAPEATPRTRPEVRPKKLTRRSASPRGKVFRMMASVSRAGMSGRRADDALATAITRSIRTRTQDSFNYHTRSHSAIFRAKYLQARPPHLMSGAKHFNRNSAGQRPPAESPSTNLSGAIHEIPGNSRKSRASRILLTRNFHLEQYRTHSCPSRAFSFRLFFVTLRKIAHVHPSQRPKPPSHHSGHQHHFDPRKRGRLSL